MHHDDDVAASATGGDVARLAAEMAALIAGSRERAKRLADLAGFDELPDGEAAELALVLSELVEDAGDFQRDLAGLLEELSVAVPADVRVHLVAAKADAAVLRRRLVHVERDVERRRLDRATTRPGLAGERGRRARGRGGRRANRAHGPPGERPRSSDDDPEPPLAATEAGRA